MKVEQIYTSCLSQGAYFIESNGEAAVIDPLRDVSEYINLAENTNSKIKYIFETHFHADFVSGHLTLAKLTGAKIVYGPKADPEFEAIIAEDNQVYFVHSYYVPINKNTVATTLYGQSFSAAIQKDNFYAVQFHTEKSGDIGAQILKQFLEL